MMLSRTDMTDLRDDPSASLTAREHEIALLMVRGLRNKAIARELQLCEGTVKVHVHNIFQKLGISSRMVLAAHPQLLPGYRDRIATLGDQNFESKNFVSSTARRLHSA